MDANTFTDLALRVIARDATDGERQELEHELARDAARRAEFDELKLSLDLMRVGVPLVAALDAVEPELPVHRVNELRTAVRQHFGPAAYRAPQTPGKLFNAIRWLVAGGGLTGLAVLLILSCFVNRTIEVGLYATDRVRDGEEQLSAQDFPAAKMVTFDRDEPFARFQDSPLAWSEHARIWVDNENDQLHIVERRRGEIVSYTQPLASTVEGQRAQIRQVVAGMK